SPATGAPPENPAEDRMRSAPETPGRWERPTAPECYVARRGSRQPAPARRSRMPGRREMRAASHHLNRVLLAALAAALASQEPPADLIREVATKAGEFKAARQQYTYRQTVLFQELDPSGAEAGSYREVRDIIFSPQQKRAEVMVGRPAMNLKRLKLTDEDFRDIREVNP